MSLSKKASEISREKNLTGCIVIGITEQPDENCCDFQFAATSLKSSLIYEALCQAVYFFVDDLKHKGLIKTPGKNGS